MSNQTRLADRLAFIELDGSAAERLRGMKDVLLAALPGALDRFYSKIQSEPEPRAFFANPATVASAKGQQLGRWDRISDGRFDNGYLAAVEGVSEIPARIGVEPKWLIGSYAVLMEQLVAALLAARWPKKGFGRRSVEAADVAAELGALTKAVFLDIDLAISAYLQAVEAARQASAESARACRAASGALRPALAALAGGDLTQRVDDPMPEGCVPLREDFNAALDRLQSAMKAISRNTQGVLNGAGEVAKASDDTSRRAGQQAAGLQQTAARLSAITESAGRTAERAKGARGNASATQVDAEQSGAALREVAAAIGAIEASSREIGTIIGVIDEIARQTHLLALNAGVEAAHAGDAGRGFAVAAADMRKLAQRSADAAREIKALTAKSGREVEHGIRLAGDTGLTLERIAGRAGQLHQVIDEIAVSADEQATGLNQVKRALTTMGRATRQNATMAEDSTAASHSLAAEAAALSELVRQFRVAPERGAPVPPPLSRASVRPPVHLRGVPRPASTDRKVVPFRPIARPREDSGQDGRTDR